mmetsp:Transcript_1407/g.2867  ORF Transcript_1407/g.2867 Transcript_1407/m.2867 type:complete len:105 (+) Transcript_1407:2055-2369(+)
MRRELGSWERLLSMGWEGGKFRSGLAYYLTFICSFMCFFVSHSFAPACFCGDCASSDISSFDLLSFALCFYDYYCTCGLGFCMLHAGVREREREREGERERGGA